MFVAMQIRRSSTTDIFLTLAWKSTKLHLNCSSRLRKLLMVLKYASPQSIVFIIVSYLCLQKTKMKLFAKLKETATSDSQGRLLTNAKVSFLDFIQEHNPQLNWLKLVCIRLPPLDDMWVNYFVLCFYLETARSLCVPSEFHISSSLPALVGDTAKAMSVGEVTQTLSPHSASDAD